MVSIEKSRTLQVYIPNILPHKPVDIFRLGLHKGFVIHNERLRLFGGYLGSYKKLLKDTSNKGLIQYIPLRYPINHVHVDKYCSFLGFHFHDNCSIGFLKRQCNILLASIVRLARIEDEYYSSNKEKRLKLLNSYVQQTISEFPECVCFKLFLNKDP